MQESTKESYPEHTQILQVSKKKPRQANKGEKSSNRPERSKYQRGYSNN